MTEFVQKFEEWCEGLNIPARRVEAEEHLMDFRKTPGSLAMSFEILRQTKKPIAQFHAILLLRETAIQNWPTLSESDRRELKSQIWSFTWNGLQSSQFENVVVSQLVRVNAVMIKRGFLDESGKSDWEAIAEQLDARMQSGNLTLCAAVLRLFEAILEEFSSEKASGLGQSLDFHRRCHKEFELTGIHRIMAAGTRQFTALVQAVSDLSAQGRYITAQQIELLQATVGLVSQCVSWNDSLPWSSRPSAAHGPPAGSSRSPAAPVLYLSERWRPYLLGGTPMPASTVALYRSLRAQFLSVSNAPAPAAAPGAFADALHELRELLMALARVRGGVFESERTHAEYSARLTAGVAELLRDPLVPLTASARVVDTFEPGAWPQGVDAGAVAMQEAGASEMLDLCLVLRLSCGSCAPDTMVQAGVGPFQEVVQFLCDLGVALLEATVIAADVVVNVDAVWAMEAFGHVLHVQVGLADWYERNVVNPSVFGPTNANTRASSPGASSPPVSEALARTMVDASARLFECSVRQRLMLARKEMETRARGVSDEVEQEDQFEDSSVVEDHMVAVAHVGRVCAHVSVGLLNSLLSTKHNELHSLASASATNGAAQTLQVEALQEELCWLVQFAGYLLADASEGERGTVPAPMAALCLEADRHEVESGVVQLSTTMLETLEKESTRLGQPGNGENSTLSPLVAEKSTWAVTRWARVYLFPDESLYHSSGRPVQSGVGSQTFARGNGKMLLARSLQQRYGRVPTGGVQVAAFLVQVVSRYLASRWSHETDLMQACIDLLMVLVENPGARESLVQHSALHDLVEAHVQAVSHTAFRDWAPLVGLEGELHGRLLGCLLRTLASREKSVLLRSFTYLTGGIEKRLNHLCNINTKSRGSTWALDVLRTLSLLEAVVLHSTGGISTPCRELYMRSLVQLLPLASDCAREYGTSGSDKAAIVSRFLASFRSFLDSQLPFATDAEVPLVSEACYGMMTNVFQQMARCSESSAGGPNTVVEAEENVWAEDLHAILQCLTLLSEKDMFDFAEEPSNTNGNGAAIGKMVVVGLTQVVPHITLKLLQFPKVTREYFRLLISAIESYPKLVASLDPAVFASIVRSLEFGINHPVVVLARRSLEAIYQLALYHVTETENNQGVGIQQQLQQDSQIFVRLLQGIFKLLLLQNLDASLVSPIANALLALVATEQQAYQSMVNDFLQSQKQGPEQLSQVFSGLFEGVQLSFNRPNRQKFLQNTEQFRKLLLGMQIMS